MRTRHIAIILHHTRSSHVHIHSYNTWNTYPYTHKYRDILLRDHWTQAMTEEKYENTFQHIIDISTRTKILNRSIKMLNHEIL